jgi:hypothetical protein
MICRNQNSKRIVRFRIKKRDELKLPENLGRELAIVSPIIREPFTIISKNAVSKNMRKT